MSVQSVFELEAKTSFEINGPNTQCEPVLAGRPNYHLIEGREEKEEYR